MGSLLLLCGMVIYVQTKYMVIHKEAAADIYVFVQQMPEAESGIELFGGMIVNIDVQAQHGGVFYTDIRNYIVDKGAPQSLALRGEGGVELMQFVHAGFHFGIGRECGRNSIYLGNDELVPLFVHLGGKRARIVEPIQHVGDLVGTYDRRVGLRPDLHGEIADKRNVGSVGPEDVQVNCFEIKKRRFSEKNERIDFGFKDK